MTPEEIAKGLKAAIEDVPEGLRTTPANCLELVRAWREDNTLSDEAALTRELASVINLAIAGTLKILEISPEDLKIAAIAYEDAKDEVLRRRNNRNSSLM